MTAPLFHHGTIPDVAIQSLTKYADERGWLAELFRQDEFPTSLYPAMGYLSMTQPGILRGPHEHRRQTDFFCFLGPSKFQVFLWDNRPESATYGTYQEEMVGGNRPVSLIIPPGIVHAYRNIGNRAGTVLNFPNQLYRGSGKQEPVDEIRHEDDPFSPFKVVEMPHRKRRGKRRFPINKSRAHNTSG